MNFRKTMLATAMLALTTGFASAQVNTGDGGGLMQCTATVGAPTQIRSEGMTELIGDIVISCTGGVALAPGSTVPTANFTVSLPTNVTSRLMACGSGTCSEASLLVDEPNTASGGAGTLAPFNYCAFPNGAGPNGCVQTVSTGTSGPPAGQSASTCTVSGTPAVATGCTAAKNVFPGIVNANQVIFNGIPVNPPVTAGTARVFRISNIRANASTLGLGGLAGQTQLLASISISNASGILLSNPVPNVGSIQSGLSTSLRNTGNTGVGSNSSLAQCVGGGPNALTLLRFQKNFATAFKTRVAPTTAAGSGQSGEAVQTVPGVLYAGGASEGGLQINSGGVPPGIGIADYGTRLKAVFNNVPTGVRLYISATNVTNSTTAVGNPGVGNSATAFAQLTQSESGAYQAVAGNTVSGVSVSVVELPVTNGTATAVWEVINTNPTAIDALDFAVFQSFTPNPGANLPPVGQATINMSYAPTPALAFSATAGGAASSSLPLPRFVDNSTATNLFQITLCQTALLFPFVTNQAGFDTGLAIANTTTDPFGTRVQGGTCTLNFFGASAPPPVTTPRVETATVFVTLASTSAAGFQGYMIAVCNFQLAHGFAFVSDVGARNLAMGYLALVLPGTGNRNSSANEALNN